MSVGEFISDLLFSVRSHKGFGILFFIWGLGALVVSLTVPFIIIKGVRHDYEDTKYNSVFEVGDDQLEFKISEGQRDKYIRHAELLRWLMFGIGAGLWALSGFNLIMWQIKKRNRVPDENEKE